MLESCLPFSIMLDRTYISSYICSGRAKFVVLKTDKTESTNSNGNECGQFENEELEAIERVILLLLLKKIW